MKPLSQINVIPFIDIMLVLLAIVMTTATFVAQGKIPVRLADSSQAQTLSPLAAEELVIDQDGGVYTDDKATTLEGLAVYLDSVATDTPILLRVDSRTSFQHFVAVLDLLKARSLDNLSIVATRRVR